MSEPKQSITIRLEPFVVDYIDYNAELNSTSRANIVNHIMKLHMKDSGIAIPETKITLESKNAPGTPAKASGSSFLDKIR